MYLMIIAFACSFGFTDYVADSGYGYLLAFNTATFAGAIWLAREFVIDMGKEIIVRARA